MSRYKAITKFTHDLIFGLDKPTGGYFFTEFFSEKEMESRPENSSAIVLTKDALTLTDLIAHLNLIYQYEISESDKRRLVLDYYQSSDPTQLQINVSKMFGFDLGLALQKVQADLNNYGVG